MFKFRVVAIVAFFIELQLQEGYSRAVYIAGTTTETDVSHFEFLQRLGNPCRIVRLEEVPLSGSESMSQYSVDEQNPNNTRFFQSMLIAVDTGLEKLRKLRNSDPNLPECKGVQLDTLPSTPTLSTLNDDQLFRELYKSILFKSAHLHLMGMDRQLTVVGVNDVSDDDVDEHDTLPTWRYLKCGNESDTFMLTLAEMTLQMESFLCTLVSSANMVQRASFRGPFNKLINTTFFRYHSSCSSLQIRDCIVMSETKRTLQAMSAQFNTMLQNQMGVSPIYSQILSNDI